MSVNKILKDLDFEVDAEEKVDLEKRAHRAQDLIKKHVKKKKISAEVFVGGSFAKETLVKNDDYDVDIFVRFDKKYKDLSKILYSILQGVKKDLGLPIIKIHGSRNYFRIHDGNLTLEIIPVLKIKKISEAKNVTDLSYFHVNYIKRNLNKDMRKSVVLAKQFCKAQKCYGAESYIGGFSGYGLECLIVKYKTFEKMLRELSKVKGKLIIDFSKRYKKKNDILLELNESKTHGPIILIDPTWKERNVLAALKEETFRNFKKSASKFIKSPSKKFFGLKNVNIEKMKKKKGKFVHILLKTDKQEGDIAGTKMKKFSNFLIKNLKKYFDIVQYEFEYGGEKRSEIYLVVKKKKNIIKRGPPVREEKHSKAFRKKNSGVYEKKGVLYSKEKINFEAIDYLKKFKGKLKEMGLTEMKFN